MLSKLLLFLCYLIYFDSPLYGQDAQENNIHKVQINIYEKGTGISLKRVEVKAGSEIFYSDLDGKIELKLDTKSKGLIWFSRNAYEKKSKNVEEFLKNERIDVYLIPSVDLDDIVIVKGERRTSVSKKIVAIEEAEAVAPGGDPAQVVRLLPGVQSRGFGSKVIVRGSGPQDSKYYIDDLEVPTIFHDIGELSLLPVPLLSGVNFESGGFSTRFGDATGGVIVLETKNEIPKHAKTEVLVNFPFYSGLYHERPLSDESFMAVSFRRSYIDYFIESFINNSDDPGISALTISPYFSDAHSFYLNKDENGQNKFSLIASDDGLKAVAPTEFSSNQNGTSEFSLRTSFVNVGYERRGKLSKEWKYRSTPQASYTISRRSIFGSIIEDRTLNLRVPSEFTKRLSKKEDLFFGFDPNYTNTEQKLDALSALVISSDERRDGDSFSDVQEKVQSTSSENRSKFAAWFSMDRVFGDLKITAGPRFLYNAQIKKYTVDTRFQSRFDLTKKNRIKLAVGEYSKHPDPREGSESIGNSDLNFERSVHYILGLQTYWSDAWESEVQVFYKNINERIEIDYEKKFLNSGQLYSQGFELFLRRNLTSRFFAWLSYTYSEAKQKDKKTNKFILSDYDQTHILNMVASYKLSPYWSLGARQNFSSGNVYTPIKKAVYDSSADLYYPREDDEDKNTARLPDVNSLSLYMSKKFFYDTWKLILKFGLESYWPTKQVFGVQNNYDYSKEELQYALPALPFLEFKGEF